MTQSHDLNAVLQRLRTAQAKDPLPAWPQRARRLRTLEAMLRDQRDAFAAAINAVTCRFGESGCSDPAVADALARVGHQVAAAALDRRAAA